MGKVQGISPGTILPPSLTYPDLVGRILNRLGV